VPAFYTDSALNTPDAEAFASRMEPGAPVDDAPVAVDGRNGWLLDQLGNRFQLLVYADDPARVDARALRALADARIPVEAIIVSPQAGRRADARVLHDAKGLFAQRFDARDGSAWLLRPDQHVAARWRALDAGRVHAAVARATCNA